MRKNLLHRSFTSCKCQSINVLRASVMPNAKKIIFTMLGFFMLTSSSLVKGQFLPQEFVNTQQYNDAFAVANEFDQLKRFPLPRFAPGYETVFPRNAIWGDLIPAFKNEYVIANDPYYYIANEKTADFVFELAKNWNYYLPFNIDGAYKTWSDPTLFNSKVDPYTHYLIQRALTRPDLPRSIALSWGTAGWDRTANYGLKLVDYAPPVVQIPNAQVPHAEPNYSTPTVYEDPACASREVNNNGNCLVNATPEQSNYARIKYNHHAKEYYCTTCPQYIALPQDSTGASKQNLMPCQYYYANYCQYSNGAFISTDVEHFCGTYNDKVQFVYNPLGQSGSNEVFEIDGMVTKAYMNNIMHQLDNHQKFPIIDLVIENTEADVFFKMNHNHNSLIDPKNGRPNYKNFPVVDVYTGGSMGSPTSYVSQCFENKYGQYWNDPSNPKSVFFTISPEPYKLFVDALNKEQSNGALLRIESYLKPIKNWDLSPLPNTFAAGSTANVKGYVRYYKANDPLNYSRNPLGGSYFTTYNNTGDNTYFPHWSIFKQVMTPIYGRLHPTPGFYPRNGKLLSQAPLEGWQRIAKQKALEEVEGAAYFSPFVSPGNSSVEMQNIRCAPYLGLLKGLAVAGADFFYAYYGNSGNRYNGEGAQCETPLPIRIADHAAQFAIPVYAQACVSLVPDFYFKSSLLNGDYLYANPYTNDYLKFYKGVSTQPTFRFTASSSISLIDPLVTIRRLNNDFLIGTAALPVDYYSSTNQGGYSRQDYNHDPAAKFDCVNSEMSALQGSECLLVPVETAEMEPTIEFTMPAIDVNALPLSTTALVNLGTIKLNSRRQGSVYMMKLIEEQPDIDDYPLQRWVLIQLDAWHEWKHPYHWNNTVIELEPEHDSRIIDTPNPLIGVYTERPASASFNDYTQFVTYVNTNIDFNFILPINNHTGNNTIAVVTRGNGTVNYTVTENGITIATGTLHISNSNNNWQQQVLPFKFASAMGNSYELNLTCNMDLDKVRVIK